MRKRLPRGNTGVTRTEIHVHSRYESAPARKRKEEEEGRTIVFEI